MDIFSGHGGGLGKMLLERENFPPHPGLWLWIKALLCIGAAGGRDEDIEENSCFSCSECFLVVTPWLRCGFIVGYLHRARHFLG